MIRIANTQDLIYVADMLRSMYIELFGDLAVRDIDTYFKEVCAHHINDTHYLYINEERTGFFVVLDITSPMAPTMKRYNGDRVYIKPEARGARLLYKFYAKLFEDFPDGDILGYTEANSSHIKVLDKRHDLVCNVYKLKRS